MSNAHVSIDFHVPRQWYLVIHLLYFCGSDQQPLDDRDWFIVFCGS